MKRVPARSGETTSPSADDMTVQRVRMPRALHKAVQAAAEASGETYADFVIGRLKASVDWQAWQTAKKAEARVA